MEGVNDATLQPVGNKMIHHDAVMCHGLIKRRYDATNRQHMIHDDAMYEPTGIKRKVGLSQPSNRCYSKGRSTCHWPQHFSLFACV